MTTKTGLIYLQRDKFQVYSPYLSNILEFRFVPELIRDFDLVNRQLFENLLKVFVANNKIPPSSMAIVISDSASFMKDFVSPPVLPNSTTPPPTLEDMHNQATEYLEHVPFEIVGSKIFPLAAGVRAYATNQEIYEALRSILEKQGFIVQTVLPGFVFGPNLSNRPTLDGVSVGAILQKLSVLQGYNLLKESPVISQPEKIDEREEKEETVSDTGSEIPSSPGKPGNKPVMLAVVISAIVLIVGITGVVLYFQFSARPYIPPPAEPAPQTAAPTVTPPQNTQPVAMPEAKDLSVQILAPAAQASNSANLRLSFTTLGVKSVVPQTQEVTTPSSNLLVFSSKVPSQVKSAVVTIVQKVIPDVIIQDKPDASFDITVIFGK